MTNITEAPFAYPKTVVIRVLPGAIRRCWRFGQTRVFYATAAWLIMALGIIHGAASDEITQPLSGNFDVGLALNDIPHEAELQSAPMIRGQIPIVIELTGEPSAGHVRDTNHALIEIDGMFPDDARCLVSIRDICVIRGHRLEIR